MHLQSGSSSSLHYCYAACVVLLALRSEWLLNSALGIGSAEHEATELLPSGAVTRKVSFTAQHYYSSYNLCSICEACFARHSNLLVYTAQLITCAKLASTTRA
jgi:hypothetical protein